VWVSIAMLLYGGLIYKGLKEMPSGLQLKAKLAGLKAAAQNQARAHWSAMRRQLGIGCIFV
jgi:hypothetical protein